MSDRNDERMDCAESDDLNENQPCYPRCDCSTTWQLCTTGEIVRETAIICNATQSKSIIQHLIDHHKAIAIDFKGINFNCDPPQGKICLVPIATCNGKCLIFDVHMCPQIVNDGGLKKLLECYSVTKVMHNSAAIRSFLLSCDVKLRSVFDTHVAHALIECDRTGVNAECINIEPVSYISIIYGRSLETPACHAMERLYHKDNNYWQTRPVSLKLKNFVARDVLCLVPEAYNNLKKRIPQYLKQTFEDMCGNNTVDTADDKREDCEKKIKVYQKMINKLQEKLKKQPPQGNDEMDQDKSSSSSSDNCKDNPQKQPFKKKPACENKIPSCSNSQKKTASHLSKSSVASHRTAKGSNPKRGSSSRDCNKPNQISARLPATACPPTSPRSQSTRKRKLTPSATKQSSPRNASSRENGAKSKCSSPKKVPAKTPVKKCCSNTSVKRCSCNSTSRKCTKKNCPPCNGGKIRSSKKISAESLVRSGKHEAGDDESEEEDANSDGSDVVYDDGFGDDQQENMEEEDEEPEDDQNCNEDGNGGDGAGDDDEDNAGHASKKRKTEK